MPVFNAAQRVPSIEDANIDKVRLLVSRAYEITFSNFDQYNAFKAALGRSELFTQGRDASSSRFSVRGARSLGERWLFSGTMSFRRVGQSLTFVAKLDLNLNPSRFINHCIQHNGGAGAITGVYQFLEALSRAEASAVMERAVDLPDRMRGLDQGDNLIPSRWYRELRPATRIMDIYLQKVFALIGQTISGHLNDPERQLSETLSEWSVPSAEIYWEYSVSDAISFVHGMRAYVEPQFSEADFVEYALSRANDASYEGPELNWQVNRNSPCLRLNPASKKVDYKIYAKEFERVRFEIVYKANVREIVRLNAERDLAEQATSIATLLTPVIENAHRRLCRLIRDMPDMDYSERCDFHSFTSFLTQLAETANTVGIPLSLADLIALLVSNHRIEVRVDSPEHAFCESLNGDILYQASAGRNQKNFRIYGLNPKYANVLAAIKREFDGSSAACESAAN